MAHDNCASLDAGHGLPQHPGKRQQKCAITQDTTCCLHSFSIDMPRYLKTQFVPNGKRWPVYVFNITAV